MIDKKYYVDGDKEITEMMDSCYEKAYTINSSYWTQGTIDKRFKVGDQSLWSLVYGDNKYYQARKFFFNLIRRQVNMVCGYQRQNRKSTIVIPSETGDDQLADDYTGVMLWQDRRDSTHEYLSQLFEGAIDVGCGLLHLYPDYTMDPFSGDLWLDYVAYNNFLIDPWFRKQDLSDCNFIWRRRWVTKDRLKTLLPGMTDIDKMTRKSGKDGRFPMQAELLNADVSKLLPYDEYYYRDTRKAKIIIDPKTSEAEEWEEDRHFPGELEQVLAQQPWLKVKTIEKPTVNLAIAIGKHVVYKGPNLLNIDRFPFVMGLSYYEPDIQAYAWRMQGLIRNLRDAQFLYNRRKVIELDILESQINSGWAYTVDSLVNPDSLKQKGQGFDIPLKKGHTMDELQRIMPPDIPASMIELSRSLAEDIQQISGINEELLGSAVDDKAGVLSMLRQGAGLTTLRGVFDRLDYAQRLLGSLKLEALRKNSTQAKIKKILGRDPDPRFFFADLSKYDLAVEEGPYSTTQKQLELQQLLHFYELGFVSPERILKASNISNKREMIEELNQKQQQEQQMQQQQMEEQANIERMKQFADSKVKMADATYKEASAAEKTAKISEIETQAEYNEAKANMELVKQIIELEDLDFAQLRNSIELAQLIKAETVNETPQMVNVGDQNNV
jgi:hypothetical protein